MLGKILKYEWKGFKKPLIITTLVMLGVTLLSSIIMLFIDADSMENSPFMGLLTIYGFFLYYFAILGCSYAMMIIVAVRYYKTCYTDQGYLTHTLPVSATNLLNGKLIASVLSRLWLVILIMLSLLCLFAVGITHFSVVFSTDLWEIINEAMPLASDILAEEMGINLGSFFGLITFYSVIVLISNTLIIFASISLGQMYTKHRILGSIIAYITVSFVIGIIFSLGFTIYAVVTSMNTIFDYNAFIVVFSIMYLIVGIISYIISLYMMNKKLNLE